MILSKRAWQECCKLHAAGCNPRERGTAETQRHSEAQRIRREVIKKHSTLWSAFLLDHFVEHCTFPIRFSLFPIFNSRLLAPNLSILVHYLLTPFLFISVRNLPPRPQCLCVKKCSAECINHSAERCAGFSQSAVGNIH